mmetsp:Transcript_11317/g.45834  ORF Transcript_11317/g.45834 Transcript_11317/m.45834 type:complete len:185 (-) Transcript_11317:230-784(-)
MLMASLLVLVLSVTPATSLLLPRAGVTSSLTPQRSTVSPVFGRRVVALESALSPGDEPPSASQRSGVDGPPSPSPYTAGPPKLSGDFLVLILLVLSSAVTYVYAQTAPINTQLTKLSGEVAKLSSEVEKLTKTEFLFEGYFQGGGLVISAVIALAGAGLTQIRPLVTLVQDFTSFQKEKAKKKK